MDKRSRFRNVVNSEQIPGEQWGREIERFGIISREAAVAVGARDLGYCLVSVDPGKRSGPYHFHHSEEEVFFVLSGRGRLRQGDAEGEEEIEIGPGDFASFPAGTPFFAFFDSSWAFVCVSDICATSSAWRCESEPLPFDGESGC